MANVRLGERFDAFVERMVASGRYATVSEVLRDGLRLLEDREDARERWLRKMEDAIQEGLDSGPGDSYDIEASLSQWNAASKQTQKPASKP